MRNKFRILVLLIIVSALVLISCEYEGKESINKPVDKELEEELDEEMNTKIRAFNLIEKIIDENFVNVKFEDFTVNTEMDDPKRINNADIYLYLNEKDSDKAREIAEEYGEIFHEKFSEQESYLAITLYWLTPNHDKENAMDYDYF